MPHDRDARRDQFLGLRDHPAAAFQLDRVRAGFLEEPDPGRERRPGRRLVGAERQVGDDEGPAGAADHRRGQRDELVQGDRDRRVVTEDDHPGRVADQEHRDARLVEDVRGQRVVRGEHGPLLAAGLGLGQVADGYPAGGAAAVQGLWGSGWPPRAGRRGLVRWSASRSRPARCPQGNHSSWFPPVSWRRCGVPGRFDHDMRGAVEVAPVTPVFRGPARPCGGGGRPGAGGMAGPEKISGGRESFTIRSSSVSIASPVRGRVTGNHPGGAACRITRNMGNAAVRGGLPLTRRTLWITATHGPPRASRPRASPAPRPPSAGPPTPPPTGSTAAGGPSSACWSSASSPSCSTTRC